MPVSLFSRFAAALLLIPGFALAHPYSEWGHSGALWILTTPEGANLPVGTVLEGFPLLVRLHGDSFDFSQARPDGGDVRFSDAAGAALPFQVEEWDAAKGTATVWVRIPGIEGNARQEIHLHWGKADAAGESNARAVFNASNGYAGVWHMGATVLDETGNVESKDTGTTVTEGMAGQARHFAGKGVFCGDRISGYPSGASPHSTEAWVRVARPNVTILGWGNEGGGRGSKVRMQFRSPPHLHIDSDFADVDGQRRLSMGEWIHVAHTYVKGEGRIYINGRLDAAADPLLDIKSPSRLWIGGWYDQYDFEGDIDEVRISNVTRSAEWVRMEYENQKPLPTLTGTLVQPGGAFIVSPETLTLSEGESATVTAQAGGAQKVYWLLKTGGSETVVATDRFGYRYEAGRLTGDGTATLVFKAVYPDGVKTKEIPVSIKESIPEPVFSLRAPAAWDGRTPIEVVPRVSNLEAMRAKGAGAWKATWRVDGMATIKEAMPEKLVLRRSQNSGRLTVTATMSNGGQATTQSVDITVTEPVTDAWIERVAAKDEKPENGQFYARDDKGEGTLYCNGTLTEAADAVFLKLYADGQLVRTENAKPAADGSYTLSTRLKPGLIKYRVEAGSKTGDRETVLHSAGDLVCGDAYLINGQSNAVATDWGGEKPAYRSEWIRTYGTMSGNPAGLKLWGQATHRGQDNENLQIGYWGMELARRLVENHKLPVCIINGAVGGTRIDQHQRNPANPEDLTTIYGRLLWRVRRAGLTHGIRGVLWHQGENDQGADGPTGGFGWETYREYFIDLAAAWKQDYPNIKRYYVFQIWPKACAMGFAGSDNQLREVQRRLPEAFSRLSLMSTLGIQPPGGCHFPAAGYAEFARLIFPVVERDNYGVAFPVPVTPPNIKSARYAGAGKDSIEVEFDQPVKWEVQVAAQFYLDGLKGKVVSGTAEGTKLVLRLSAPSTAGTLSYVNGDEWSGNHLLRGANGLAALTFWEVPVLQQP